MAEDCASVIRQVGDAGRSGTDNHMFVNGCLWILRFSAHWKNLPERYGKWKMVHRRFNRWCHAGVWEKVFEMLTADRNNQYLMLVNCPGFTGERFVQ